MSEQENPTTPSPELPWVAIIGMRRPRYFATRQEAENWAIAQPGGSIVAPAALVR